MRELGLVLVFIIAVTARNFNVEYDVSFNVFTMKNPTEPQALLINDIESIGTSNFDPKQPTNIFIHGFQSGGELRHTLLEGYFIKGARNLNMIEVNWEEASRTPDYYHAARSYVEKVGSQTAKFVDFMVNSKLMNLSDLTVIGFSLGAHCAGFTGKFVTVGKLPKIIALDPAGPFFSVDKPDGRLNETDALYVECVHTSELGFFHPLGDVDFYANGGRIQPGCSWDLTGKCSHQTAYKYLALSIHLGQPLIGHKCKSLEEVSEGKCSLIDQKAIMFGETNSKQMTPGIYYISIACD